jgi:colicin import membrane protein
MGGEATQFYVRLRVPKNMMNGAPPLRGKGKAAPTAGRYQRLRIEAKAGSFPSARNDTTMAEQKESSVLFSLKELMNLEEDRIKQEETERQRQEQAVVNARLEAERKAREEEEARMAAAEEHRRQGEQRSREEQARLEAIRHAELEKARLDAENAARLEQLRAHQAHEQNITALKQDKGKKNLLYIAVGVGILLFVVMIGGGIVIKGQMDKAAALQAQLGQLAQDEADIKKQMSSASAEDRARLQDELDAKEAAIQNLKDHPNAVQTTAPVTHPVSHGGGGTKPPATSNKPPCNCTPGDPLCSCL